jgi:regulator of protease activity HflC (stomatin/prohibitin superfamily)
MPTMVITLAVIVVLGFLLLTSTIKIVQEYERGVIFRLRRLVGARGPGLFFLVPGVERMRKVDLRIVTLEVPAQEAITRDNVTVNTEEAVVKVLDYTRATSLIGQTTLRSIIGQSDLDHLLPQRDKINAELQQVIDTQTSAWGVKVTSVEVRDLELPQSMQRATARQAEAEHEKRAKVIHAEGEFSASQQLANAAQVIGGQPATLQLRYLQTLTEIAAEKNATIVFPLPLELLQGFFKPGAPERGRQRGQRKRASSSDTCMTSPRMPPRTPSETPRLRWRVVVRTEGKLDPSRPSRPLAWHLVTCSDSERPEFHCAEGRRRLAAGDDPDGHCLLDGGCPRCESPL